MPNELQSIDGFIGPVNQVIPNLGSHFGNSSHDAVNKRGILHGASFDDGSAVDQSGPAAQIVQDSTSRATV